jgi:hypothetical protein
MRESQVGTFDVAGGMDQYRLDPDRMFGTSLIIRCLAPTVFCARTLTSYQVS